MNNLIVKSILGLVFLLAFMGFILFLSAGTIDYWQAWLYLAAFGVPTLLITLYLMRFDQKLLASRVAAGPTAETDKTQQIIQSLAGLLFMLVFIVAGIDNRYHWSSVPTVVSLVADGLVVLGFYFVFLVFKENSYTSATIEVKQDQTVISTGPYSVVRHPMYAGAGLLMLVTPLALGSWVALPFPILLMISIGMRAIAEEKYLAANLNGYDTYRQQVRYRIIPFVW